MGFRRWVRDSFRSLGYDLSYYDARRRGVDPLRDMRFYLAAENRPLIFDVGANVGQTTEQFLATFPQATIHSFEPSPRTFAVLSSRLQGRPAVKLWNVGVGSTGGVLELQENSQPEMSSFLSPGEHCWGRIETVTQVPVVTLDAFAAEQGIEFVHVLKSDTQGFELEVFKGAEQLLRGGRVGLVYFELNLANMYVDTPPYCEVLEFLQDCGYILACIYECHYHRQLASWTDLLFIGGQYYEQRAQAVPF